MTKKPRFKNVGCEFTTGEDRITLTHPTTKADPRLVALIKQHRDAFFKDFCALELVMQQERKDQKGDIGG